jgi:SAM-dependent methyltransferase
LVVHYLKNPEIAFKEFNRVLKKSGVLIFSTNHPVFSAYENTEIKENKTKVIMHDYFNNKKSYWTLHNSNVKIPLYKISLEKLFSILYKNNFIVEEFKEPHLTKKQEKKIDKNRRKFIGVPTFIVLKCRKLK